MVYRYHCIDMVAFGIIVLVLLTGLPPPQVVAQDINALRGAADQGLVDALLDLGRMYYTGEGVPQDFREAAKRSC